MAVPDLLDRIKRGDAPYGVVASFLGECGPRDLDGARWKVLVSDGISHGVVVVELTGTNGGRYGMNIDPEGIERATERIAGRFPVKARAASMLAVSEHVEPLPLSRNDLDTH